MIYFVGVMSLTSPGLSYSDPKVRTPRCNCNEFPNSLQASLTGVIARLFCPLLPRRRLRLLSTFRHKRRLTLRPTRLLPLRPYRRRPLRAYRCLSLWLWTSARCRMRTGPALRRSFGDARIADVGLHGPCWRSRGLELAFRAGNRRPGAHALRTVILHECGRDIRSSGY